MPIFELEVKYPKKFKIQYLIIEFKMFLTTFAMCQKQISTYS